jgi:hypothetical protein
MISYPLYLWHWPVLSLSRQAGLEWHPLLLLVLSAILAIVTFELVERRIQMRAPMAVWKPLWTCMAAIAGVSLAIVTSNGLYMRYPADVVPIVKMKEYDYGKDARLHVCWREPGKDNPIFPLECSSPSLSGAILIVGALTQQGSILGSNGLLTTGQFGKSRNQAAFHRAGIQHACERWNML